MASAAEDIAALKAKSDQFSNGFVESGTRFGSIENAFGNLEKEVKEETKRNDSFRTQMVQDLSQAISEFRKDKATFEDAVGPKVVEQEIKMQTMIDSARNEFESLRSQMTAQSLQGNDLYNKCDVKFNEHKDVLDSIAVKADVEAAQHKTDLQTLHERTENTFLLYEGQLKEIEGVKSVEKFAEISLFGEQVKKFAEEVEKVMLSNNANVDCRFKR